MAEPTAQITLRELLRQGKEKPNQGPEKPMLPSRPRCRRPAPPKIFRPAWNQTDRKGLCQDPHREGQAAGFRTRRKAQQGSQAAGLMDAALPVPLLEYHLRPH